MDEGPQGNSDNTVCGYAGVGITSVELSLLSITKSKHVVL